MLDSTEQGSCQFCELLEETDYELALTESKYWVVALSFQQHYPGRSIIVLKRHISSFCDLTVEEMVDFQHQLSALEVAVKKVLGATAFNVALLMNGALATIPPNPHVHFHIIPRYKESITVLGHRFEDTKFGNHYDPVAPEFLSREERCVLAKMIREEMAVADMNDIRGFATVETYAETEEDAINIARHVMATVEGVPTAHIEQVHSLFKWDFQIKDMTEYRVSFDVVDNISDDVVEAICQVHPYVLPGIALRSFKPATSDFSEWVEHPERF